ncbi:MAG: DUF4377 domain-containing protein, partial [Chloroflexota bacterium]
VACCVIVAALLTACVQQAPQPSPLPTMVTTVGVPTAPTAQPTVLPTVTPTPAPTATNEKTVFVGSQQLDCVGVGPQKCLLVKYKPDEQYRFFYGPIAGFMFVPGFEYELLVKEEKIVNPPADGAAFTWTLIKIVKQTALPTTAPSEILTNAHGENNAYLGIGRFKGTATCTGTLIKTADGAAAKTAPAYILTNGHCAEAWDPNRVIVGDATERSHKMLFNYFQDTREQRITVAVKQIAYATMKGSDLAIVKLDATLGALMAKGIQPFTLAADKPKLDTPIDVIAAPQQSSLGEDFLRLTHCTLGAPTNVIERQWHFFDAYRNACAAMRAGSAGAPVLARNGSAIVAVINTTTAGSEGATDCDSGRPCEADASGYHVLPDTNYATPVIGLRQCFDASGAFSLSRDGCPLDPGRQLTLTPSYFAAVNPTMVSVYDDKKHAAWNVTLAGKGLTHYRYKIGPANTVDCRKPDGYGNVIALATASVIADAFPTMEDIYYLCVLAGPNAQVDATWQKPSFASVASVKIDVTPPRRDLAIRVDKADDNFRVDLGLRPPELAAFRAKWGKPDAIHCADPKDYALLRRPELTLNSAEGPYTLCVIAYDDAGNAAPTKELSLK